MMCVHRNKSHERFKFLSQQHSLRFYCFQVLAANNRHLQHIFFKKFTSAINCTLFVSNTMSPNCKWHADLHHDHRLIIPPANGIESAKVSKSFQESLISICVQDQFTFKYQNQTKNIVRCCEVHV